MAWIATKHFVCEGIEYGIGDSVPMDTLSAKVQQHLVTYKHVREANPEATLKRAANEGSVLPSKAARSKRAVAKAGR